MSTDAPTPTRIPASRYVVFATLAAAGCAIDLATKHWAFAQPSLAGGAILWWIDGIAGVQRSLNEGALFGMGQGATPWFAALSALAAVAIPIWLFGLRVALDLWMTVALGLVMGGVLGNLYDRVGMPGLVWGVDWPHEPRHQIGEPIYAVRDWVLWQASDRWRWPNFNIADALLVVGAGMLVLRASFPGQEAAPESPSPNPQ
ncbi:signal peptidase II [Pirellulimonas nuda]|uniref:signal peptidase II n=1 Tax=Pirellulimonas nuda TaxID=2528009 RepID=UPI0018D38FC4|nr:signal peptidase II [Pirellulimonas nuda]